MRLAQGEIGLIFRTEITHDMIGIWRIWMVMFKAFHSLVDSGDLNRSFVLRKKAVCGMGDTAGMTGCGIVRPAYKGSIRILYAEGTLTTRTAELGSNFRTFHRYRYPPGV